MTALVAQALTVSFGSLRAVADVDLALPAGARHALIGPNGAGKTTLVALLTGLLRQDSGRVLLLDEDVTATGPEGRVRRGLSRTFQVTSLFPRFSALEATTLAIAERERLTWRCLSPLRSRRAAGEEAAALLDALGVLPLAMRPMGELAYGQQRVMEIALALAGRPRVLILDEPAAGIPAGESRRLFDVLERLPDDLALLFIEHDMHLVRRFARQVTVMAAGRVIAEGTPAAIAENAGVREAYLGRRRA